MEIFTKESIYLILFCLKEHVRMQHMTQPFLLNPYFLSGDTGLQVQKPKKTPVFPIFRVIELAVLFSA
jgi:hypothetical protein